MFEEALLEPPFSIMEDIWMMNRYIDGVIGGDVRCEDGLIDVFFRGSHEVLFGQN